MKPQITWLLEPEVFVDFPRFRFNCPNPDPAWTLDVCESWPDLAVVEVNSFSCAGLYACDYEAVVQAINELP